MWWEIYKGKNASNHKKTDMHKKWEKEVVNKTPAKKIALSILLNHAGVSDDVIGFHILPWFEQIKFRDSPFPRILIDYTRIQNPNLFDEYNKLTDFESALNIPQLLESMKLNYLKMFEGKFYGVLKNCDDYCELDKLPFFLLMMKESEGIKIESDNLEFYKDELLSDEWDFSEYSFYLEALCDKRFSEQLFNKLLIDHKYLLQVKN